LNKATYDPGVFAVSDIRQAMDIILTPWDKTTEERWQSETEYLAGMIGERLELTPDSLVLDYGCGIGRMAKALIERYGCSVLGADISAHMRMLGISYVLSDRFASCSPDMLDRLVAGNLRFDAAISIWVLQHCARPAEDIARIRGALKPSGSLFAVNMFDRAVPTVELGWADDGIDVKGLLSEELTLREDGILLEAKTSPGISQSSYWACFGVRT
jgi:SAM-dependent methyltransferase